MAVLWSAPEAIGNIIQILTQLILCLALISYTLTSGSSDSFHTVDDPGARSDR